ncbi:hypothetical protein ACLOAU_14535 [Niabella sp. CJ426]|uniref:hypothetical protein n=1 Tax=Niabella sp. CJ426 TaxID=3393740 RepID=UPI003CFCFF99
MKPEIDVGIQYGAIGDTLLSQIKKQGFKCDPLEIKRMEKIRESITILGFQDFMSHKQRIAAYKKLHKMLVKHLAPLNQEPL